MKKILFRLFQKAVKAYNRRGYERKLHFAYLEHISTMLEGMSSVNAREIDDSMRHDGLPQTIREGRTKINRITSILEGDGFYKYGKEV